MDIEHWEIVSQIINTFEFIYLGYVKFFPTQPQEIEEGNREYKINLDFSRYSKKNIHNILNKKATQMNYRLFEGGGCAIYFIGVSDTGGTNGITIVKLLKSLLYFTNIVTLCKSKYNKIRIYPATHGYISTIRVYKKIESKTLLDIL